MVFKHEESNGEGFMTSGARKTEIQGYKVGLTNGILDVQRGHTNKL